MDRSKQRALAYQCRECIVESAFSNDDANCQRPSHAAKTQLTLHSASKCAGVLDRAVRSTELYGQTIGHHNGVHAVSIHDGHGARESTVLGNTENVDRACLHFPFGCRPSVRMRVNMYRELTATYVDPSRTTIAMV